MPPATVTQPVANLFHRDPASSTFAIAACGINKSFGSVQAVVGLNLTVMAGETVALLGPNGAGKTTTISLLLGLLRPDQGEVRLFGHEPDAAVSAGLIGASLQDGGLMPGARVGELLAMLASLYPSPLGVGRAVAMAQLDGLERRRVDRLSGGQ
ncbi:MAG: ATP-binding cassette domain-containing protein, partial [Actinomycetota bacterium]|nr:ATP-binding cassette domain-containing protein [Actinomycetota bacterium]